MINETKELTQQDIERPLHQLLCDWGFCISGAEARRAMYLGNIKVNGEKINNMKFSLGDITLKDENSVVVLKKGEITFSVKKDGPPV